MYLNRTQSSVVATSDYVPIAKFTVSASAGGGAIVPNEDQVGQYAFSSRWIKRRGLKPDSLAIITVTGDSMEPKLRDNDLILVDRDQRDPSDGRVYVVRIGDELLVKHIQRTGARVIDLISTNPIYPARTIDLAAESDSVQIIGRVVASMQEW
ncbi:S24 family peptidase [Loktanella sp. 3ANDIMAR09]|uniref:S24 family peptidase n=1 Tax=Loktanella sp. 3ANDIMAR09 TaxID=1225657 RepID=UPI0006FB1F4B|nr:S24 family peptidase [Loktanella sp. 3ANDIMAR09]